MRLYCLNVLFFVVEVTIALRRDDIWCNLLFPDEYHCAQSQIPQALGVRKSLGAGKGLARSLFQNNFVMTQASGFFSR